MDNFQKDMFTSNQNKSAIITKGSIHLSSGIMDSFQDAFPMVHGSDAEPFQVIARQEKDLSGCGEALFDEILCITAHTDRFQPSVDSLHDGVVEIIVSGGERNVI